jgi:hypothetical protein
MAIRPESSISCSDTAHTGCPGNILLMRGHFLSRGKYTPECHQGLGQNVWSADETGIARVIPGDEEAVFPTDL